MFYNAVKIEILYQVLSFAIFPIFPIFPIQKIVSHLWLKITWSNKFSEPCSWWYISISHWSHRYNGPVQSLIINRVKTNSISKSWGLFLLTISSSHKNFSIFYPLTYKIYLMLMLSISMQNQKKSEFLTLMVQGF